MSRKHFYTLLLTFLVPFSSFACRCAPYSLETYYEASSHVAVVRILKVEYDPKDRTKLLVDVEVLDQIKGKKTSKYKTNATFYKKPDTEETVEILGCTLELYVGSTWLFLATSKEKTPFVPYCSMSTNNRKLLNERVANIKSGFN